MPGLLLILSLATLLEDPLLPEPWRGKALSLARSDPRISDSISGKESFRRDLGELLFYATGFSENPSNSCASCHDAERAFQDQRSHPRGLQGIARDTPSLWGVSGQRWWGWDGRWDSLWAQALEPIESVDEMGGDRLMLLRWIDEDDQRRDLFEKGFGPLPSLDGLPEKARSGSDWHPDYLLVSKKRRKEIDLAFSKAGRSIAAFEATLEAPRSSFDDYMDAVATSDLQKAELYPAEARRGLILFLDKGRCILCHGGPLLSDGEFHDTGLLTSGSSGKDSGRYGGILELKSNPFNLEGQFSTASEMAGADRTSRLKREPSVWGAFRTPALRGIRHTAPYFHDGSQKDLKSVIRFYTRRDGARKKSQAAGHHGENLMEELNFTPGEEYLLERFLETL